MNEIQSTHPGSEQFEAPGEAVQTLSETSSTSGLRTWPLLMALLALVTLAYANHFQNEFHFDDSHTIVDNPYIRDLRYLPRFFISADTFSIRATNRSWRPMVSASLAVDYWLGQGLKPLFFHLSTFLWFLVQVCLIYALALKVCHLARSDPNNRWIALFGAALYGVHPAGAETVNYIIQRGDLYSTLGVIAGVVLYAYAPGLRKWGIYLLPVLMGIMSKPPALVFPAILFVYIRLFEEEDSKRAGIRCVPALLLSGILAAISAAMTPTTFNSGSVPPADYRLTQPLVALRYFRTFGLPTDLTADTGHVAVKSVFEGGAWLGFLFVAALIVVAVKCSFKRELRPIAFGLYWFLLALLPTSLFVLAEVENTHRMFFPFVGLAIAASWTASCLVRSRAIPSAVLGAAAGIVLLTLTWGTWQRNRVWRSEESLWLDVTLKAPTNPRGLMGYGTAQMAKRNFFVALDYFQQALIYKSDYSDLEMNIGFANAELHRDAEADRHFARGLEITSDMSESTAVYGAWLRSKGRLTLATRMLTTSVGANPDNLNAWHELLECYMEESDGDNVRTTAEAVLSRFPDDGDARYWLEKAATLKPTPELYVSRSLAAYRAANYSEAVADAQAAIALRPDYAEAWNNLAIAQYGLGHTEEAFRAEERAVALKPDYRVATENLAKFQMLDRRPT